MREDKKKTVPIFYCGVQESLVNKGFQGGVNI